MELEKNRLSWQRLRLRIHPPRQLVPGKRRRVCGFDTETLNGYARICAASDKSFTVINSVESAIAFLTSARFRYSLNFFWNIQFDVDALMKYLGRGQLEELYATNKLQVDDTDIQLIPNKKLSLRRAKKTWAFYDAYLFYEMSLERAGRLYAGMEKNEGGLDRSLIGSSREYWIDNYDAIVDYCIQDASITARLGDVLQDEIKQVMEFYPKSYVSKAALSKQYFRYYTNIPDITKVQRDVQRYAFESYHGGHFEVTERGNVGECSNMDISSAYPAEIADLIDITRGVWKRVAEISPDAYYGFYLAKIQLPYAHICPYAVRWGSTVIYPWGEWHGYFTRKELMEMPAGGRYSVISGYEFYPSELIYPFRERIHHLYDAKRKVDKDSYQYALYKKVLNSLYGVFYQKHREPGGMWRAGPLFNPIYASIITAHTRMKLWQQAARWGSRCVSLATDGLLVRGDVSQASEGILGGWDVEIARSTIILRSGFYKWGDEVKQRGVMTVKAYNTPYGCFDSVFDYIQCFPGLTKYPIRQNRPWHMREQLAKGNKGNLELVNVFEDHVPYFDLNTDIKRVFERYDLTGEDIMRNRITSQPYCRGGEDVELPP